MPPSEYPSGPMPGQVPPPQLVPAPMTPIQPPKSHSFLIPLIIVSVLFIGAAVFAIWAFMGRQDYKNNVQQKVDAAVQLNTQSVQKTDAANYAEQAKYPLKSYVGPAAYGNITIKYPKTWSAYVDTSNSSNPVNGYFQPNFVPSIDTNSGNNFALRLEVLNESYDQVVSTYTSQVQQGQVKISSYTPVNVKSDPGVVVTGAVQQNKQGTMIILPLRANTLELWTESESEQQDFVKNILPNFTFSP